MARLVFGMMQSLDGYVDGAAGDLALPPSDVELSRHFNDRVRHQAGSLYGRRIYEIMRYYHLSHGNVVTRRCLTRVAADDRR